MKKHPALMQAGNCFDLVDAGKGNEDWILAGWIKDLSTIGDEELKAIFDGYSDYMIEGIDAGFPTETKSGGMSIPAAPEPRIYSSAYPGEARKRRNDNRNHAQRRVQR